jgi:hypothetical protein
MSFQWVVKQPGPQANTIKPSEEGQGGKVKAKGEGQRQASVWNQDLPPSESAKKAAAKRRRDDDDSEPETPSPKKQRLAKDKTP